jgi:hypothetical protein
MSHGETPTLNVRHSIRQKGLMGEAGRRFVLPGPRLPFQSRATSRFARIDFARHCGQMRDGR